MKESTTSMHFIQKSNLALPTFADQFKTPIARINVEPIDNDRRSLYHSSTTNTITPKQTTKNVIETINPEFNYKEPIRKDRMGRKIDKKEKKHHITFRDDIINENVEDVIEVDSYKYYNAIFENDDDDICECKLL